MAKSTHITKLTRRAALKGGVSVVALAGVAAAAVAAVPTGDPHPAWLERRETADAIRVRRYNRLERRYGYCGNFPPWLTAAWGRYENRSWDEHHRLTELIVDTRAYTPEGMAVKAYLLWYEGEIGDSGKGPNIGRSLIADLQHMATRPLTDFEAGGFAKARAVFGDMTPVEERRKLCDAFMRIAGRLGELEPKLSGQWIKLS